MDWKNVIGKVAPTVASALLGPLAGTAVSALGELFGISEATEDKIAQVIENRQMTGEQIAKLRELELKLKSEESERGFKYADLEVKDREGARQMFIQTGAKTPAVLTWIIVAIVLGLEGALLFGVKPDGISDIVLGRILGTLDTSLAMVLSFWFGTTHGSSRKTDILAAGGIK